MMGDLANRLSSAAGAALLVRHAERPEIPAGSFGHDLRITEAGHLAAAALGAQLGPRLGRVVASSVPRCVQTGAAILAGSGLDRAVSTDRRLGDPGIWIADEALAGESFLDGGSPAVVRRQLAGGVRGMHSLQAGTAAMLACFFDPPSVPGQVDVFISHDAVMAPLLGHLLRSDDFDLIWPSFLEGAWFVGSASQVSLRWRDREVSLGAEVFHGS